jgi:hypothetical protein
MKKGLLVLLLLMCADGNASPLTCPSTSQIQQVGLSKQLIQDNNGRWYAGRTIQNYGTPEQWTFIIGGIRARNESSAYFMAQHALKSLRSITRPVPVPADKWLCLYSNHAGYLSGAITPPVTGHSIIGILDNE